MITINKHVRNVLKDESSITDIVGTKIYSLFIPDESVKAPFIILNRIDNNRAYVKDVAVTDTVKFSVVCVAEKYTDVIDLANKTDLVLDTHKFNESTFKGQIRQVNINEAFTGEYMIDLEYEIKINYK